MIFTYKKWNAFCKSLCEMGIKSIPAREVSAETQNYLVLKHDVETNVKRAFKMAEIEYNYGHNGSYYVQAYLLESGENIDLLLKMQEMGHEISYHYDVMDSNKGDINMAIEEFEKNKMLFEEHGFKLVTLCQHGNPIVERVGYTSNRDFFRNEKVQKMYPDLSDIMVDFKTKKKTNYTYFSDAGRKFKLIFDPINNDIVNSDDKNIVFEDLKDLLGQLQNGNVIISTHPHRWTASAVAYILKATVFKFLKLTAKILIKLPIMKKFMSKYYYLAKKV